MEHRSIYAICEEIVQLTDILNNGKVDVLAHAQALRRLNEVYTLYGRCLADTIILLHERE
jgi:hypothetical protein